MLLRLFRLLLLPVHHVRLHRAFEYHFVDYVLSYILVGAEPSPDAVEEWDYVTDGEIKKMRTPVVVLANTALRTVRPRTATMDRSAFAEMIRQTCEQTNLWVFPTTDQLSTGTVEVEKVRAVIDQLCRSVDYVPAPKPADTGAVEVQVPEIHSAVNELR